MFYQKIKTPGWDKSNKKKTKAKGKMHDDLFPPTGDTAEDDTDTIFLVS